MRKFTTLLWDVDQTLLDFEKSQDWAIRKSFSHFAEPITDEIVKQYDQINQSYWLRLEKGEVTKQELLTGRFQTLFEVLGIKHISPTDFQKVYQRELGSVYFYKENSLSLLRELKESGSVRQYIVTNGVEWTQRNKLKLAGIDQLVEDIFISDCLGATKPQKEFFDACFARIPDFKQAETLIIGDSLSSDIKGGVNAGIATCWYNPEHKQNATELHIDYEIDHLEDIRDILRQGDE